MTVQPMPPVAAPASAAGQVPQVQHLSALPQAVEATTADTIQFVEAPITVDGEMVFLRVLPSGMWRNSALNALNIGHFQAWAEAVLAPESLNEWDRLDPTLDAINKFIEDLSSVDTGPLGVGRRTSSRRSPTR